MIIIVWEPHHTYIYVRYTVVRTRFKSEWSGFKMTTSTRGSLYDNVKHHWTNSWRLTADSAIYGTCLLAIVHVNPFRQYTSQARWVHVFNRENLNPPHLMKISLSTAVCVRFRYRRGSATLSLTPWEKWMNTRPKMSYSDHFRANFDRRTTELGGLYVHWMILWAEPSNGWNDGQ